MSKEKEFNVSKFAKEQKLSKSEEDALKNIFGILKNGESGIMDKIKLELSDAYEIVYDTKFSIGSYKIYDVIGNMVGRAILDKDNEVIVIKNEHSKRMN
jgi:hypothetical protein